MKPDFYPWLFDCHTAWSKAVSDPRWNYSLPISSFMAIYNEYRAKDAGLSIPSTHNIDSILTEANPSGTEAKSEAGQILDQNEIDNLLSSLK
ncbi:MAG: hypothetical protein GX801_09880 [Fibrobacter sp.]|nr:hypothetical protein [Fibrobacter sp.]